MTRHWENSALLLLPSLPWNATSADSMSVLPHHHCHIIIPSAGTPLLTHPMPHPPRIHEVDAPPQLLLDGLQLVHGGLHLRVQLHQPPPTAEHKSGRQAGRQGKQSDLRAQGAARSALMKSGHQQQTVEVLLSKNLPYLPARQ